MNTNTAAQELPAAQRAPHDALPSTTAPRPGNTPPHKPPRAPDRPPQPGAEHTPPERSRWAVVTVMAVGMLMVTLEMSLSSVTLPAIGRDLGVGSSTAAWVLLAYALPGAALAIPAGRWIDTADHRAVFLVSAVAVGATSVLAAVAPTFGLLIAARVAQGVAGAVVAALYMPVVAANVRPEHRGRAMGYFATIMPVGSMAGAALGGLVADTYSWRAVFLLKLPVLAVVFLVGRRVLPGGPHRAETLRGGLPKPDRRLLADGLVLVLAVTVLLLALNRMGDGGMLLGLVLLPAAAVLAVVWGRLDSARPVLGLVRRRAFGLPLLSLFLVGMFSGVSLLLVPFYVADVMDRGAGVTGVVSMFFVGALVLTSSPAGALADRFSVKAVVLVGAVVTLAGVVLLVPVGSDAGVFDLGWRLAVIGVGQAFFGAPISSVLMGAAPPDMVGMGGGIVATVRTLSFTVGPAVAATAYGLGSDGVEGFRTAVLVLVVLQVLGLLATLAMPRTPAAARH